MAFGYKNVGAAAFGLAAAYLVTVQSMLDIQREVTVNLVTRADDILATAVNWCHDRVDNFEA